MAEIHSLVVSPVKKAPGPGLLENVRLAGHDADVASFLRATAPEMHVPVGLGEQGVVSTDTNVLASVELRPTLAHQDIAGQHTLAAITFHP